MMRAEASLSPVSMDSFFTPSRCSFSRDDFAFSRGTSRSTMRAASLPSIATYAAISSGSRGANSEFTSGFLEAPASGTGRRIANRAIGHSTSRSTGRHPCAQHMREAGLVGRHVRETTHAHGMPVHLAGHTLARLFLDVLHHG